MSKARDIARAGTALANVDATELGYLDGVTSNVQTQLDAKQAANANVSTTELGYLDGVTSAIQTQLDSKAVYPSQTGNSGKYLTTNGTTTSWGAVASGPTFVGCSIYSNTAVNVTNAVLTTATYDAEHFDTDGFHSNTTNNSRITIPSGKAGKYLLNAVVAWSGGTGAGLRQFYFYKNGVELGMINRFITSTTDVWQPGSMLVDAIAGDYFEIKGYQTGGSTATFDSGSTRHFFQAQYLGT